ncbi:MAG: type II toxin-antitoxin system RelE/ParE family toxin [Candidatus Heimdallarchaeota archaeon]|nr:type II toxin-antitoxin system RelE/ParE family toxin [Candidatus Heimdallarchaeota archaeon]
MEFSKNAAKFLKDADKRTQELILGILEELRQFPREGKILRGNLSGKFSWRVGKFRIIYQIIENRLVIYVINIGLRKNIYEK